jgi:hypothetical protein
VVRFSSYRIYINQLNHMQSQLAIPFPIPSPPINPLLYSFLAVSSSSAIAHYMDDTVSTISSSFQIVLCKSSPHISPPTQARSKNISSFFIHTWVAELLYALGFHRLMSSHNIRTHYLPWARCQNQSDASCQRDRSHSHRLSVQYPSKLRSIRRK